MQSVPSYFETFAKYEHIYDMFVRTDELVNFHPHVRAELAAAYRNVEPHYHYNDACSACIAEMIVTIYRWYKKQK